MGNKGCDTEYHINISLLHSTSLAVHNKDHLKNPVCLPSRSPSRLNSPLNIFKVINPERTEPLFTTRPFEFH